MFGWAGPRWLDWDHGAGQAVSRYVLEGGAGQAQPNKYKGVESSFSGQIGRAICI